MREQTIMNLKKQRHLIIKKIVLNIESASNSLFSWEDKKEKLTKKKLGIEPHPIWTDNLPLNPFLEADALPLRQRSYLLKFCGLFTSMKVSAIMGSFLFPFWYLIGWNTIFVDVFTLIMLKLGSVVCLCNINILFLVNLRLPAEENLTSDDDDDIWLRISE